MKRSRGKPQRGRGCAPAKQQKRLPEEQKSEPASRENDSEEEDQIQSGAQPQMQPQMQGLSAARESKQHSKTVYAAVRDGMRAVAGSVAGAAAGAANAVSKALFEQCQHLLSTGQMEELEACPVPDGAYIQRRTKQLASFATPEMTFCDEAGRELVQTFTQVFLYLRSLGQAMQWEAAPTPTPALLMVGEAGKGKSTLLNHLAAELCKNEEGCHDEHNAVDFSEGPLPFQANNQPTACTKKVQVRQFAGVRLLDSPGMNDGGNQLSDSLITEETVDQLKADQEAGKGLSVICHCAMVDAGGRLNGSTINCIAKTVLQIAGAEEGMTAEAPKFLVVFTAMSALDEAFPERREWYRQLLALRLGGFMNMAPPPSWAKLTADDPYGAAPVPLSGAVAGEWDLYGKVLAMFPDEQFYAYDVRLANLAQELDRVSKLAEQLKKTKPLVPSKGSVLEGIYFETDVRAEYEKQLRDSLLASQGHVEQAMREVEQHDSKSTGQYTHNLKAMQGLIRLALSNVQKISRKTPWAYQKMRPAMMAAVRSTTRLVNTLAVNEKGEVYKKFNQQKLQEHEAKMEQHKAEAATQARGMINLVKARDERAAKMIKRQAWQFKKQGRKTKYLNAMHMRQCERRAQQQMDRVTAQFSADRNRLQDEADAKAHQWREEDRVAHREALDQLRDQYQQQMEDYKAKSPPLQPQRGIGSRIGADVGNWVETAAKAFLGAGLGPTGPFAFDLIAALC